MRSDAARRVPMTMLLESRRWAVELNAALKELGLADSSAEIERGNLRKCERAPGDRVTLDTRRSIIKPNRAEPMASAAMKKGN